MVSAHSSDETDSTREALARNSLFDALSAVFDGRLTATSTSFSNLNLASDLSMSSLDAVRLLRLVDSVFGVSLSPAALWSCETVGNLEELLLTTPNGGREASGSAGIFFNRRDLDARVLRLLEASSEVQKQLPTVSFGNQSSEICGKCVVVTGAAGQLGRRLVHGLVTLPEAQRPRKLICLVRVGHKIVYPETSVAVELFHTPDLALPRLGLSLEDYQLITQQMESIVHAAGNVSSGLSCV